MTTRWRTAAAAAAAAVPLGLLGACGGSSGASDDSPTLDITSPANDHTVGSTFQVAWDSSVRLGQPDTGRDHVHLYVDGQSNDYTVVRGNDFTLTGLSPGKHTVHVTLQHADHSPAGADDEISVIVGSGGASDGSSPSEPSDSRGTGRYDY